MNESLKIARSGLIERNPAAVQLLGLCPLLAVSNSVVTALGLAMASAFVVIGSNTSISLLRHWIPNFFRLPTFVLIIATFTTCAVLLLEAFAFAIFTKIALFVQIIVTNCMILGRAETFASKQRTWPSFLDALGTAGGFALALLALGCTREIIGHGTLGAGLDGLFGSSAVAWELQVLPQGAGLALALMPPGAFIVAGLLLGLIKHMGNATNSSAGSESKRPGWIP